MSILQKTDKHEAKRFLLVAAIAICVITIAQGRSLAEINPPSPGAIGGSVGAEPGFTASGWLEVKWLNATGGVMNIKRTGFEVSVSNRVWQLTAEYGPGHYTRCGSDGANTYGFGIDQASFNRDKKKYPGLNSTYGEIDRGNYPVMGPPYTFLPWLALASGPFLDRHQTNYLPSFWNGVPGLYPLAHAYGSRFQRGLLSGGVPQELEYVVSSNNIQKLRDGWIPDNLCPSRAGVEAFYRGVGSYVPGRIDARYRVISTTNWNNLTLPLEFEFERYLARHGDTSARLVRDSIKGAVTNLALCSLPDPRPAIPTDYMALSIMDTRYRDLNRKVVYLSYRHESKEWPGDRDPKLLEQLKGYPPNQYVPVTGRMRSSMIFIIFALPCLPLWWVWRAKRNSTTK